MATNVQPEPEESAPGHPAFSRLSLLRAVWKRKILIAAVWVLLAGGAVAVVWQLPAVYLAEAVVLIDSQKIPEKFVSATVASDLEERIISIRQQLLSGGELKKIIEEFGLYAEQRKNHVEEEILDMMRKDISIEMDSAGLGGAKSAKAKRPGAFRIGYQGRDRVLVMRVANRLTDLYVEQNLKTREGHAAGTSDFLDTQLREAKKSLDDLEAAVSQYKLQHNGELPQQEQSIVSALARLQTELETNRDAINRAQQTRVVLESNLSAAEAMIAVQTRSWEQALNPAAAADNSPSPSALAFMQPNAKGVEALQQKLDALRSRYRDSHPDVVALRKELEAARSAEAQSQAALGSMASAAQTPRTPAVPLREPPEFARSREQVASLRAQLLGAAKETESRQAEQKRILHDIETYQRRLEHLPIREQEMAQITRDYEISKENYKSLLDKRMAAGMALDMERRQQSERFIILDRAQVPERPIKPRRALLCAGGCGAGLALALLMGFALELRRNVFLGEWELPAGTPVLARLPYIEVPVRPARKPSAWGWPGRKRRLPDAAVTACSLVNRL